MSIEAAIDLISISNNILFITGAGMSVDSGLPTYRGIGGLYDNEYTAEGMRIEEALSGTTLKKHPEICWKYMLQIGQACYNKKFNKGHKILAEIEKKKPNTHIITQNVDGYHKDAGSQNVIEVHGNIHRLYCTKCKEKYTSNIYEVTFRFPPICTKCQGLVRPDVVLFGEYLSEGALKQLIKLEEEKKVDLVISIGTSSMFQYITRPIIMAKRNGIPTIEINPGETDLSDIVDFKISSTAVVALDEIWHNIK